MKNNPNKKRIVVAMSGGVDSSVAAYLLHQEGHEVIGISMRLWSYDPDTTHGCCTPDDLYDARRVADQLGIPYYVFDFEKKFEGAVVDQFVESYRVGETPNPCVRCNTDIKFDVLLQRAHELGADMLATGHYARLIRKEDGSVELLKGLDPSKDQSYFLFGMSQEQLSQLMFPLGDMTKDEVREIGRKAGILTSDKKDSQEICFVPTDYKKFVRDRISDKDIIQGNLVDEEGKVLGKHQGIHEYTIGQRKGINIPTSLPMFVSNINKDTGDITIGQKESLMKTAFTVKELRYTDKPVKEGDVFRIKIRSRFDPAPAKVQNVGETLTLEFLTPQKSITPGQAAVLYDNDKVVGGGFIDRVLK